MKRLLAGALFASAVPCIGHAVPAIQAVHGVQADRDGITVRAPAQGLGACTPTRQNMTIAVSKEIGGVTLLVTSRGSAECRARGGPADIHWSYEELGLKPGQPFSLANPLAMAP